MNLKTGLKPLIRSIAILIPLLILFIPLSFAGEDEWQGWRGLKKQACSDSDQGPVIWSSSKNILWKVNIEGEGYSSPVVTKDSVFITAARFSNRGFGLNAVIVCLLTAIVSFLILRSFVQVVRKKGTRAGRHGEINFQLYHLFASGLMAFCFCIMLWMFFNENRTQSERILISYFFSGSVVLYSLVSLITLVPPNSIKRILLAIMLSVSALLLVKYHPIPEFYFDRDFFRIENLWIFQLIIPGVILPVLFSLFVLIKFILTNYIHGKAAVIHHFSHGTNIVSSPAARIKATIAFLLGLSGFLAIPAISLVKWLNREDFARIQSPFGAEVFLNPEYSYPFFLSVISIGYLFLFLKDFKGDKSNLEKTRYFLPSVMIIFSLICFALLKYGTNEPSYIREIICLDRYTGEIKWKKECITSPAVSCSNYNSQATPTPLTDGENVYAYFGSAGLYGADKNGRIKWENTNLPFKAIHGVGGSPVFCKDGILLLNSMAQNPFLALLDSETGIHKWESPLPPYSGVGGEYRTPLIADINGEEVIIEWSSVRAQLVIYGADSGKTLYQYSTTWETTGESVSTPLICNDVIYLPNKSCIAALDISKLSVGEAPVLWIADLDEKGPDTSSPVLVNGMLFMISDAGIVSCLNSLSGEIIWQRKLTGTFFSSPVAVGNKIYFSNCAGTTTVLNASAEFRVLAQNNLPEGIYATPAPVDGQLFIRTKNTLWCIK